MQQQVDTWWHELNTWNALEARNFYRRALGWSFEKITLPDGEPYWLARKDGKTIGGMYNLSAPKFKGIPAHWMTYMAVEDINKAEKETVSAGGEVMRAATDIPGIGRIAIVADAAGALIGLMEPALQDSANTTAAISDDDLQDVFPADFIPPEEAALKPAKSVN